MNQEIREKLVCVGVWACVFIVAAVAWLLPVHR